MIKKREIKFIIRMKEKFSKIVTRLFPDVPFDELHPPEKFVGLIKVKGQRTIALFIKSHQPIQYDEIVL